MSGTPGQAASITSRMPSRRQFMRRSSIRLWEAAAMAWWKRTSGSVTSTGVARFAFMSRRAASIAARSRSSRRAAGEVDLEDLAGLDEVLDAGPVEHEEELEGRAQDVAARVGDLGARPVA